MLDDRHFPALDRPFSRRELIRYGGALGFGAFGASMLAACSSMGDAAPPSIPAPHPHAKYLAVVIVDACRADYLRYGDLPNVKTLMRRGVYFPNAFSGIMESTTPACHAALGTGSFPKNNGGILGFWWEDPTTHANYDSVNLADPSSATAAAEPRSLEMLVKQSKAPTMAGLLKSVDPTAKVYTSSGVKFYAADAVGGPDADYITYFWNDGPELYRPLSIPGHEVPADLLNDTALTSTDWYSMTVDHPGLQDRLVVDLAVKVIKRERPRIVVLNLPEMDWPVAHLYGGPADPSAVTHLMENADASFGKLVDAYREMGIFHETVFCFMGDHGVLPLDRMVDPSGFKTAVTRAGTTLTAYDYHTGGFHWLSDPGRAPNVAEQIDALNTPGVSGVYYLAGTANGPRYAPSPTTASSVSAPVDRAYRYLLETMNGANAPHVVVLYAERTGTLGSGGNYPWKGDHGGASWASQAVPVVMAGPGLRASYRSAFPVRLVDLAPTFLRLLGAPYSGMDGIPAADAFSTASKSELAAERVLSSQLTPMVHALRTQSAEDVKMLGPLAQPPKASSHGAIPLNPAY